MGNSVKVRIWPRTWRLRVVVALVTIVLVVIVLPYALSRVSSPWRRLSIHEAAAAPIDNTGHSPQRLRIACYNIAHGRGLAESNWDGGNFQERQARLDEIAGLLRKVDADVVVLNEVDFQASWSYGVNQSRYLAEQAGYPYWVEQRNLDFRVLGWTWRFGNAVLSKQPIADAKVIDLPAFSQWEPLLAGKKRGVICTIDFAGQSIRVVGAHLSHRSEAVRVESAHTILNMAKGSSLPTIFAGDLNSTPPDFAGTTNDRFGENAIATFDHSGRFRRQPESGPPTGADFTFHSNEPHTVIDWILIPRDWRFAEYIVHPSKLSDHRLVYADVEIVEEADRISTSFN